MTRLRRLCAALAVLPLAAGCTASPDPEVDRPPRPAPALRLVSYDSCETLRKELEAVARAAVPEGFNDPRMMPNESRAGAGDVAAGGGAAPPAYSGTNVHEAGVDEPDLVKTDGRRIVTVTTGGALRVVDASTRTEKGKLDLGIGASGPAQLLLSGDRALVLTSGSDYRRPVDRRIAPGYDRAELIMVDLSGAPTVISRYSGDGRMIDARQNGSVARVVLTSGPKIGFPYERRATGIDAWLPEWEVTTGSETVKGRLDCDTVSRPDKLTGASLTRVLTFDLTAAALGDGTPVAVAGDSQVVYGTPTSLYLADGNGMRFTMLPENVVQPDSGPQVSTSIYRFELPAAGKPVFVASGQVPGTLLNQYSLSEWDGHLRVATTDPATQTSAVRVLREKDGNLTQVGEAGGLGKDERIYSVRFIGARGYVVTFRQTDPLYSLDLRDPQKPRVTGELKIPGYSAHLQPIGENLLIGIGQDADATDGRRLGAQVSLFDVTDPADPKRLAQHFAAGTETEAEFDPHAVLWWPATNLLVLPVTGRQATSALALRVADGKIQQVGRLTPPDDPAGNPLRRTLVIGDVLWTVSESGLLAANLSTLDRLAWVPLS